MRMLGEPGTQLRRFPAMAGEGEGWGRNDRKSGVDYGGTEE